MTTSVTNPEWLILNRCLTTLREMAADREFVRSASEMVASVKPAQIYQWRTLEGGDHNQQSGFVNIPTPSILVTVMPVRGGAGGVNCADDEVVTVVIQIIDAATGSQISRGPIRTYGDWMNRIRHTFLDDLTIFRQDFDPAVADPYIVVPKDRVPADPQKLWYHEQQVAAFSFYVKVRHHRTW